jgi:hypothetical protein
MLEKYVVSSIELCCSYIIYKLYSGLRYNSESVIHRLQNRLVGEGREEMGATPLACCVGLTVIRSGAHALGRGAHKDNNIETSQKF